MRASRTRGALSVVYDRLQLNTCRALWVAGRPPKPASQGSIPWRGAQRKAPDSRAHLVLRELHSGCLDEGRQPLVMTSGACSLRRARARITGVWGNGRPLGLGPSLRRFDSCHSDEPGGAGSSPVGGASLLCGVMAARPACADWPKNEASCHAYSVSIRRPTCGALG